MHTFKTALTQYWPTVPALVLGLCFSKHIDASAADRPQPQQSPWFMRTGPLWVAYQSSADINLMGSQLSGASARARNNVTFMFDLGYEVTDNFSVLMMGGIPPRTVVQGAGSVEALGNFGAVRYGPLFLTGIYYFPVWQGIRPYLGAGMAHAFIFKNYDGAVSDLDVKGNSGPVVQMGVEYAWNQRWTLFADYKHLWLELDAHGELGPAPVKAKITLDPDLLSMGIKFHF